MKKSTAEVVAHSKGPNGDELITVVGTFPRIILAEVNTHRMLSKNTSSSRAIPFFKMVKSISDNPFIPYAFQKHHSGMQGTEYLDPNKKITWEEVQPVIHEMLTKNFSLEYGDWAEIEFAMNEYVWPLFKADETGRTPAEWWLQVRNIVVGCAVMIYAMGVTKQIANRLLEPFMWVADIITGTREAWESFFYLRAPRYEIEDADKSRYFRSREETLIYTKLENYVIPEEVFLSTNKGQAEIHMMDFAESCWNAIRKSKPRELKAGEWHIPFRDKVFESRTILSNNDILKVSTAMCARVSYTVVGEEKEITPKDLTKVYDEKLIDQDPPHCFTEDTEVLTNEGWKYFKDLNKKELIASVNVLDGKFIGFEKPNSYVEKDYEGIVYTYKTKNIDISVTPNHKLLGISVSKVRDRIREYDTLEIIEPQQKISEIKTLGEREMIMFSAPAPVPVVDFESYKKGQLLGFFLGDGSARYKSNIHFRLKKERKILYITNLLKDLDVDYTIKKDSTGIYNIKANAGDYTKYYNEDRKKAIPKNILENIITNVDFISGLFDGLKNSDGSVKRNTWTYSTSSTELKENVLFLCPLVGLTGVVSKYGNNYKISFLTNNRILLNDSRRPESKCLIEEYKGKVYCVETPSHGIIVRKNGKTVITHNSSPFEHCARVMITEDDEDEAIDNEYYHFIKGDNLGQAPEYGWCNNFKGFIQLRYLIEKENFKL